MRRNPLGMPAVMCFALLLSSANAGATVIHDEAGDGDLSSDRFNPTSYSLSVGTSSIIATSVSGDREFVTLNIPGGAELSALTLATYAGLDDTAFIAIQSGTTMTVDPDSPNPALLLGYSHFGPGPGNVGTDILDDIGMGAGSIGFTPPLPAGDYTFWIQQTGGNAATYQFDFGVTPEPASLALLGMGGLALIRRRRATR
jgi:hypothetical protein